MIFQQEDLTRGHDERDEPRPRVLPPSEPSATAVRMSEPDPRRSRPSRVEQWKGIKTEDELREPVGVIDVPCQPNATKSPSSKRSMQKQEETTRPVFQLLWLLFEEWKLAPKTSVDVSILRQKFKLNKTQQARLTKWKNQLNAALLPRFKSKVRIEDRSKGRVGYWLVVEDD